MINGWVSPVGTTSRACQMKDLSPQTSQSYERNPADAADAVVPGWALK